MGFESWLIGFIEAEGSFNPHKKVYPEFCLSQNEEQILEKIQDFFGVGSIYHNSKKNVWQYRVYGRNCWPIRNICENRLVTKAKKEQFEKWKELNWTTSEINNSDFNLDFGYWLIGFVEGEGSFTIAGRKYPEFSISQKNGKEILGKIKEFFGGIGSIRKHGLRENAYIYTVSNAQCWRIREFCESKLLLKKKIDQFEGWKQLMWGFPLFFSKKVDEDGVERQIIKNSLTNEQLNVRVR